MKIKKNEYLLALSALCLIALMVPVYEVQGAIIAGFVFLAVMLSIKCIFLKDENWKATVILNKVAVSISIIIMLYFMAYFLAHEKGSGVSIRNLIAYTVVFGIGSLYFVFNFLTLTQKEFAIKDEFDGFGSSKRFLYACYGLSFLMLAIVLMAAFRADVWDDEICSLITANNSYRELIRITALDVHPPLYYIILKIFSEFIVCILTLKSYAIAGKLVSIIPVVLLLIYNRFAIRKIYGKYVEGCFALLIAGTFQIMLYSVEIRMYSWALLFVTLAFLKAMDALRTHDCRSWIGFTLFSILAAYTHIYAFIAAGYLYLYTLWALIRGNKEDRATGFKKWICSALVAGAAYAPWILVIFNQTKTISGDGYWIPPVTITSFVGYINFLFGRLSLIPIAVLAIYVWYRNAKEGIPQEIKTGLFVSLATVSTGTLVSIILFPVFVPRYILPLLLCVSFAIVVLVHRIGRKDIMAVLAVTILCITFGNGILFAKQELVDAENDKMYRSICEISNEEQFTTDDWNLAKCAAAERKEVYYCGEDPELKSRFDQELYRCIHQLCYNETEFYELGE